MKKIALFSLLALGMLTVGTPVQKQNPTGPIITRDLPPPDCMPNNCF